MLKIIVALWASTLLWTAYATEDQDRSAYTILLKNRQFEPSTNAAMTNAAISGHVIVQFHAESLSNGVRQLKASGMQVLQWVPGNAVMVAAPSGASLAGINGVRWAGKMTPSDKVSRHLGASLPKHYALVDAFPDVSEKTVRHLLANAGAELVPNPWMPLHTYLVRTTEEGVDALAREDAISWIWPASDDVISGEKVHYCPGPMTAYGYVPNFVTNGPGWDGAGLGSASLTYHFLNYTPDLTEEAQRAEIIRALNTWSKYAAITWTETETSGVNKSMDILFASGEHGDGSPFDGPSNVLAHCFYPSPPNGETIAGDCHFDEAETWKIGEDFDLFFVALHESGHGLGLNHSDDENAVMYPFYRGAGVTDLNTDDINGIRSLYAPALGVLVYKLRLSITDYDNNRARTTLNGTLSVTMDGGQIVEATAAYDDDTVEQWHLDSLTESSFSDGRRSYLAFLTLPEPAVDGSNRVTQYQLRLLVGALGSQPINGDRFDIPKSLSGYLQGTDGERRTIGKITARFDRRATEAAISASVTTTAASALAAPQLPVLQASASTGILAYRLSQRGKFSGNGQVQRLNYGGYVLYDTAADELMAILTWRDSRSRENLYQVITLTGDGIFFLNQPYSDGRRDFVSLGLLTPGTPEAEALILDGTSRNLDAGAGSQAIASSLKGSRYLIHDTSYQEDRITAKLDLRLSREINGEPLNLEQAINHVIDTKLSRFSPAE